MNDENITKKIQDRERPTDGIEFRIGTLEKHNQIRKISSTDGLTYFDTASGEFQISNASGTVTWTAGQVVYKNSAGVTTRISNGSGDTYYDANGVVTRVVTGTKDSIYDGANEVVRLGDLS